MARGMKDRKPTVAAHALLMGKSNASKQIKKEAKNEARKDVIDKAVVDKKDTVHYILLLDDSGSMSGKPWTDLRSASVDFLTTLANSREASSSRMSCVIYNSYSRIVFQNQVPSTKLVNQIQY